MNTICEPVAFAYSYVAVTRTGPGLYRVDHGHRHDGDRSVCKAVETYEKLSWSEALDVAACVLDEHRPGAHPAGWEQLPLFG